MRILRSIVLNIIFVLVFNIFWKFFFLNFSPNLKNSFENGGIIALNLDNGINTVYIVSTCVVYFLACFNIWRVVHESK